MMLGRDSVSVLGISASKGTSTAEHEVQDSPGPKYVDLGAILNPKDDLRCDIAWRAHSFRHRGDIAKMRGCAKVAQDRATGLPKEHVLWFDIPVHYVNGVYVCEEEVVNDAT